MQQKALFQEMRNYLAGRVLGATRDRALLDEVMKCMFSHKQMLLNGGLPASHDEIDLAKSYRKYFQEVRKHFGGAEEILLDPGSISFIHQRLSLIPLLDASHDPVGDLYETFIGASVRGSEGQFFTPQNAGRWLVDAVAPSAGERVIDPACGAGGFLLWAAQRAKGRLQLFGIEKDNYLASLAKSRTAILGLEPTIYCANALSFESESPDLHPDDVLESFDVVLTNPPFGKNINSVSAATQQKFSLGKKWRRGRGKRFESTDVLANKCPPQVLFMERVISLLKRGGRAGIVVPESLLSSRSYAHVVQYIQDNAAVRAVIGMPEALFKSSGKGGTHTKTALLVLEKGTRRSSVFMAEAKWCGNDSRGRIIEKDDLPRIADDYQSFLKDEYICLGYRVDSKALRNGILSPRYHEPSAQRATAHLTKSHDLVAVSELLEAGRLEIRNGNEVGKMAYGTGSVPFVRTSDISGWEIKIDPKHGVSEDIYNSLKPSQDVRCGDILMVRDGTYLIGSCAIITKYDERIVYQSHIYKLRSRDVDYLPPTLLLAILSSDPVQQQVRAKTFTQDIIDSLGSRIMEIVLPIPKKKSARSQISDLVSTVIRDRVEARELSRKAKQLVVDPDLANI